MVMGNLLIHIQWEGPIKLSELSKLNDESKDYGIYQIYGCHPVYGSDVLLYIGKAARQTFCSRISQEGWQWNRDADKLEIYAGYLAGSVTPENEQWCKEIDLAEKLLIYSHAPAYNSQNIKAIPDNKELQDIHILNWGNHRDLMPEVSGERWTSKYDNIDGYSIYGTHEE